MARPVGGIVVGLGVVLAVGAVAGTVLPRWAEGSRVTEPRPSTCERLCIWPSGSGDRWVEGNLHSLALCGLGWRQSLFSTNDTILRVLPVHPPGYPPQLLVLTAERMPRREVAVRRNWAPLALGKVPARIDSYGGHPLRSHLYLIDPMRPDSPRLLSLEPSYNFWAMSAGDVDGDGVEEIGLCTWSRTVRDSRFDYRFFVYGWNAQGDLAPRFRGSRLSRPLVSAVLSDLDGARRAELLSVEKSPEGGQVVVAYAWNQFGFRGIAESKVYREVVLTDLGLESGHPRRFAASILDEDESRRVAWMRLAGDRIVPCSRGGP